MRISDETQRDTKEPDHMGAGKHERLFFSMSPTGSKTSDHVPIVVRNLVDRLMSRGKGSFIGSVLSDRIVTVTVLNLGCVWKWEVKKDGAVVDYGIATMCEAGVELRKGPPPADCPTCSKETCPNCQGLGVYDDQTCQYCDGECQVVMPEEPS